MLKGQLVECIFKDKEIRIFKCVKWYPRISDLVR